MPSGITTLAHSRFQRVFAPTLLAFAGVPLLAEDQPAPPKPTAVPVEVTPVADADQLKVESERENQFKAQEVQSFKLDLDLQHIPQSITVLNADLLCTTGAFSLRDALRSAPGVTMAAGENGRTGDSLVIRGFAANSDTYIDGLKDNAQYARDTFNIQQVEILKGPSGLQFGRGVTGGAVNMITKKPTDQFTGNASVTAGSYNLLRFDGGISGPIVKDQVAGRLDAYYTTSDSFRDEIDTERWGASPSVTWYALPTTDVTLQYFHQHEDSKIDYGIPLVDGRPADVPITTYYGFKDDNFQEFTIDTVTGIIIQRFSENISLRNAMRYTNYDRYYRNEPMTPATAGPNPTVRITQNLRDNTLENFQNQTELSWNGKVDGRALSIVVGVDLLWENYYFKTNTGTISAPISVFDPQQPDHNPGSPAGFTDPPSALAQTDAQTIAGYAMVSYEFIKSWTTIMGARFDRFSAEYQDGPSVVVPTALTHEQTDNLFNPRVGLVWDPVQELSLYASYATSTNPTAEGYTISAANDGLDPEKNVTYEIGAKAQVLDGALLLTGAVFRLEKTNARTPDPVTPTVNVLEGVQRSDGFELGAAGRVSRSWNVYAGYAFLDSEIVKTNTAGQQGNTPVNAPRHSGSIWVTYDIGWGFDVGTGCYAASERYLNAANTASVPGYARFDLGAGWTNGTIYTRVNIFNVLDTLYYENGNASANNSYANPGVPLSGQVTLGAMF